jgi:hypothetical protein
MGEKHEEYLAGVNAGRKSKASGSQWTDPADGRNAHDEPYALAWDGKSTLGKSIAVTLDMIRKIREQALGEIPQIGLRWYANQSLRDVLEDWVAVPGDDWKDILASARSWRSLVEWLLEDPPDPSLRTADDEDVAVFLRSAVARLGMTAALRRSLAEAHQSLIEAGEALAAQRLELDALRSDRERPREMAQWVPRLPWTVVHVQPQASGWWAGDVVGVAVRYHDDGTQVPSMVTSVRVQRSAVNRPHLFVDNLRVRNADVYNAQGKLALRVCEDDASIEVEQGA